MFREAFRKNYHESNTGNPNLHFHSINTSFGIIFKAVWGSIDSTITWTYAGRSGDQNMALSVLQNIQTKSSTHPTTTSMKIRAFSLAVKWPVRTV